MPRIKMIACQTFATLAVSACAHLPDVTVQYYLPTSTVSFKVVRTVTCDSKDNVLTANGVTPTVTHYADSRSLQTVSLANLRGTFSDSDVKFEFYDDGRLKSINGASTGQGEAILKTAISVTAAAFAAMRAKPTECAEIRKLGGDKPLALLYQGEVDIGNSKPQKLPPDPVTAVLLKEYNLKPLVGEVCATVQDKLAQVGQKTSYKKRPNDITLTLREPGVVKIRVSGGASSCTTDEYWNEQLRVAQVGVEYELPLPPATAFGKRVFAASFSESGALTLVQFASESGAEQALNVASAAMSSTEGQATAERAAAIKAEADLIAQQQRLLRCVADPSTCE